MAIINPMRGVFLASFVFLPTVFLAPTVAYPQQNPYSAPAQSYNYTADRQYSQPLQQRPAAYDYLGNRIEDPQQGGGHGWAPNGGRHQRSALKSITVAGGPIASKHFQSGSNSFNERHTLTTVRVDTEGYGNWGIYFLNPNSVNDSSVGGGYVTDPYTIPMGYVHLELTGVLGLVTGYQDYPVPMVAGDARLSLYQGINWNMGLEMAAMPYLAEDPATKKNKIGIVATSPFLSLRYSFN
jgi:hypothetical protein